MTPEQEAEIRAREKAATKGPWIASHRHGGVSDNADAVGGLGLDIEGPPEPEENGQFALAADAQFIAHAREDVPRLLSEIERLRAERDELREEIREREEADLSHEVFLHK